MPAPPPPTFWSAVQQWLPNSAGDPAVTFYDVRTGERVELSYATYSNWVAKTASLLQDELGVGRGDTVAVDLPTHWLGPVWLGAVWAVGACVVAPDRAADVLVCGPAGLAHHTGRGAGEVVACSLLPLGVRFSDPLPAGVIDFGAVVWGQPDRLLVLDPPAASDPAWEDEQGRLDQADLLGLESPSGRVVSTLPASSRAGLAHLVGPLLAGAGTVWVTGTETHCEDHLAVTDLGRIARDERAQVLT